MCSPRRIILTAAILLFVPFSALAGDTSRLISVGPALEGKMAAVTYAEQSSAERTLTFRASHLEVADREKDGAIYQLIRIPGENTDGAIGGPELPLVTRLVAVPDGWTLRVTAVKTDDTRLEGTFRPWPAQGLKDRGDSRFDLDPSSYVESLQKTAPPLVTVGEPSLLRGVRVVPVRLRPVTWNPGDGSLEVASTLEVTLELAASQDANRGSDVGRLIPRSFATIYENQVLGYEKAGQVLEGHGSYLVIYPDDPDIATRLLPLFSWRQRQGYNVIAATTASTGTTTESIKSFIQVQYNSLKVPLEFVTLVGDANGAVSLPTYNENLSGYSGEGDHEYTLLEGNDVLSDIHIGRLSVTSNEMLTDVVNKIVNYENDPYMDETDWFTRAGLSADPGSSGYSTIWVSQWVKQQLTELNYTQIDTIWSGNFASQIYDTVSQGETLFTYRGYLNMSGVNNTLINNMNNGEKLPFALIVTCDTGSFEYDVTCRSEAFFRNPGGGAVASMGTATIGTHTRYNNCMFQGVAEGIFNSGDSRIGTALTTGKLHLFQNYSEVEPDEVEVWSTWNNIMGDPATPIWTAVPSVLTVEHPDTLTAVANNLPVVVASGGQPQAGALVSVTKPGVFVGNLFLSSGVTDENGRADIPLSGLTDGIYLVTVTGANLKPHLGRVNVGTVSVEIGFASLILNDDGTGDSIGNGDGVVNPGETVEILVDLTNSGTDGIDAVTGDLGSSDSLVEVIQPSATFGYIAEGDTVTSQQAFVVNLDPAVRGNSVLRLPLVGGDGANSWTTLVNIEVSGPAVDLNDVILAGGVLDPGESTTLEVELRNTGDLITNGVTATLSSNSNWVRVTDPDGTFGPIHRAGLGDNAADTFTLEAAVDCFPGHVVTLTLDLVFAEGGTASLPILVTIGNAVSTDPTGPDAHGYFAFDDTDAQSGFAPVYNWAAISPDRGGSGTSAGLTDTGRYEDDVVIMPLPFPFTYYGQVFNEISICANGWVSMGGTDLRLYRNWTLPSLGTPDNMIAVYWDDLHIRSSNSGVWTWYDTANNQFIVEWDNVANSVDTWVSETFQLILKDPVYEAGDTGDGIIVMNYKDITPADAETGFATVGIQNEDRDDAVLYTYWDLYPGGSAPVTAGRSILYRTVVPQAQGTLLGMVTNTVDGSAVDAAALNVVGKGINLFTDTDGQYQGSLAIGTYDIAVSHPSFAPDTTFGVIILEETETVVDFSLVDTVGPAIELLTMPESSGDTVGPYEVTFEVTDFSGIDETKFYYTSSSGGGPFELVPVPGRTLGTLEVSIPGQPDGSLVQYWVVSEDLLGMASREPAGSSTAVHAFMVASTTVIYSSDMENATDWTGSAAGDDASSGTWANVDPNGVAEGSNQIVPEDDYSDPGTMCWVTGQDPVEAAQGTDDVDGGTTTLVSPVMDLGGLTGLEVQYQRWYTNDTGFAPGQDDWIVQALASDGSWVDLENTSVSNRAWQQMTFLLDDLMTLGSDTQLRFIASDLGDGSVVEAAVDDFRLTSFIPVRDAEAPLVSLTAPDSSQAIEPGQIVDITWSQSDDTGVVHVEILLSTDGGVTFEHPVAEGPLNGTYSWTVPDLQGNTNRLKVICHDAAGNSTEDVSAGDIIITVVSAAHDVPGARLTLSQNSPNPFNPRTKIHFTLPSRQEVRLRIYNLEGRLVRTLIDGVRPAGLTTVDWSGKDDQNNRAASGLYFYRLTTDSGTLTRKMTLLK